MAQSRPPPVRVHTTTASSPPLFPRTHSHNHNSEKRHHSRRKSGSTEYVLSEKKSSRPAPSSRKDTPQHVPKVGSNHGKSSHRDRDDEERGRDSGESFPQFCMSCEKQFLPSNSTFLYCSEACRIHDLEPPLPTRSQSYPSNYSNFDSTSPPLTPYSQIYPSHEDGPDIIPRFSPTQSRPRSYFTSESYPASYQQDPHTYSSSTPHRIYNEKLQTAKPTNTSALESLREIATALPKTSRKGRHGSRNHEENSPPKSSASSIARSGSAVWGYIPFANGNSKTNTPAATPGNSYTASTQAPYTVSQSQSYSVQTNTGSTYGYGYGYSVGESGSSREDLYAYGKSHHSAVPAYGNTSGMAMDRPLPPRSGPGGYGHRPKSVDLVTPYSGY